MNYLTTEQGNENFLNPEPQICKCHECGQEFNKDDLNLVKGLYDDDVLLCDDCLFCIQEQDKAENEKTLYRVSDQVYYINPPSELFKILGEAFRPGVSS